MQVLSLKTRVSSDGHLHLDIPTSLAPGDVELVLVVNNAPSAVPSQRLSGLIGAAKGSFATPAEADAFLSRERDSWGS
jgi:hypothetical protein